MFRRFYVCYNANSREVVFGRYACIVCKSAVDIHFICLWTYAILLHEITLHMRTCMHFYRCCREEHFARLGSQLQLAEEFAAAANA